MDSSFFFNNRTISEVYEILPMSVVLSQHFLCQHYYRITEALIQICGQWNMTYAMTAQFTNSRD